MTGAGGPRAVRRLLLALFLLVPLAPDAGLFTGADEPKRAVLVAGVLAALILALLRALRSKEETKVPLPDGLAVLAIALPLALFALRRAPDPRLTLLAVGEMGALVAAGVLAARVLAEDGTRAAAAAFLAAAAVAAVLGLAGWPAGRASVFGNPSFAAEFIAGALPLAWVFLSGRGRLAALAAAAAGAAFLALSRSRADVLGFLVAAALLAALRRLSRLRSRIRPAVAAGLLLAGILALPYAIDALPVPLFGRSDTVAVRRHLRAATWRLALAHPATGVGPGGFRAAYPEVRPPEEATLSLGREVSFPHHLPSLVLAETGFPGLAALLAFLFAVLWGGLRTALARPEDRFAAAATAGVAALLVSAQFSAPLLHPGSALLFFVLAGLLAARRPRRLVTRLKGRRRRALPVLVLLAPVVVAAFVLPPRLRADALYQRAVARELAAGGGMDATTADLLARSAAVSPKVEALRQLALYLTLDGRPEEALARLDTLFRTNPFDEAGRQERARALLALGRPAEAMAILEALAAARPADETVRLLLGLSKTVTGIPGAAVPELFSALRALPPDAVRRNAKTVARTLGPESWDGFLAQVSTWSDVERALDVLSVFGSGHGDYYRALVLARERRLDEAMAALRAAALAGTADRDRLLSDPRLAPLRSRADFPWPDRR